jgi:hypothetical protein
VGPASQVEEGRADEEETKEIAGANGLNVSNTTEELKEDRSLYHAANHYSAGTYKC